MANQPGYQAPGQSNAAGSAGPYYQNQISGAGYGPVSDGGSVQPQQPQSYGQFTPSPSPSGGSPTNFPAQQGQQGQQSYGGAFIPQYTYVQQKSSTPQQYMDNPAFFGGFSAYQNPMLLARQQQLQGRDYVGGIEQALKGQLQGLNRERSGAQQQLMNQQMNMGFGGLTGMDIAGLGQQYAESAAGMQRQGNLDIQAAMQQKEDDLYALEQQMGAESQSIMQGNSDAVMNEINQLTMTAQSYTGPDGATVMVNPNILQELDELRRMAFTKAVDPGQFQSLVSGIMARYGKSAYISPDGTPMGDPSFNLAKKAPSAGYPV